MKLYYNTAILCFSAAGCVQRADGMSTLRTHVGFMWLRSSVSMKLG